MPMQVNEEQINDFIKLLIEVMKNTKIDAETVYMFLYSLYDTDFKSLKETMLI